MSEAKRVFVDGHSWELVKFDGDSEHRIRDLDLAEELGFEHALAIRKLIQRHAGKLNEFGTVATVEMVAGFQRPAATEYWLNRKQAIFVAMKSETPKALDMQVAIVRVFDAVVFEGATQSLDSGRIGALERKLDKLADTVVMLAQHISVGGYIAPKQFEELWEKRSELADVEVLAGTWKTRRAALADIDRELRDCTGWGSKGKLWREMPSQLAPTVNSIFRRRMKDATKRRPPRPDSRQLSLIKTG